MSIKNQIRRFIEIAVDRRATSKDRFDLAVSTYPGLSDFTEVTRATIGYEVSSKVVDRLTQYLSGIRTGSDAIGVMGSVAEEIAYIKDSIRSMTMIDAAIAAHNVFALQVVMLCLSSLVSTGSPDRGEQDLIAAIDDMISG